MKNYKSVELPSNFAWQLLQSEIELEVGSKVGINLVQKLLELYALGVEYFESLRSYKYLYFQKKMNNLMVSPQFMQAMNNNLKASESANANNNSPQKTPQMIRQEEQDHKKILLAKNRQDEMQKQMKYSTAEVSAAKVKTMIENTQMQANQLSNKIQNQLSKQNSEIMDKIEKRRKRAFLSKSFSLADMTRHSSKELLSNPDEEMQKKDVKLDKIRVDFANIINQNEQDEEERPRRKNTEEMAKGIEIKPESVKKQLEFKVEEPCGVQQGTIRKRNKTLKGTPKNCEKAKSGIKTHSEGIPETCDFAQTAS